MTKHHSARVRRLFEEIKIIYFFPSHSFVCLCFLLASLAQIFLVYRFFMCVLRSITNCQPFNNNFFSRSPSYLLPSIWREQNLNISGTIKKWVRMMYFEQMKRRDYKTEIKTIGIWCEPAAIVKYTARFIIVCWKINKIKPVRIGAGTSGWEVARINEPNIRTFLMFFACYFYGHNLILIAFITISFSWFCSIVHCHFVWVKQTPWNVIEKLPNYSRWLSNVCVESKLKSDKLWLHINRRLSIQSTVNYAQKKTVIFSDLSCFLFRNDLHFSCAQIFRSNKQQQLQLERLRNELSFTHI